MQKKMIVIVGVINDCNSDCLYCYMLATRRTKCELPRERISQLIQNCSTGFDEVEFCWHGGEPLLVGIDFYRLVIKEQERIATNQRVVFKNTIQTNGILLNDEWLQFFKKKNSTLA